MLTDTNLGVIILCPDCNPAGLRYTSNTLRNTFPEVDRIATVGKSASDGDIAELSRYCQVHRAGRTITSLIDVGLGTLRKEWGLVLVAGGYLSVNVFKKYVYFTRGERDILFPVVNRKHLFHEASISGILVNRRVVREVGEFGDGCDDIEEVKLRWADRAIAGGYTFKALVGAKVL